MAEAIYRRGQQEMVHHAFAGAVAEGEVQVIGPLLAIPARAYAAGELGAYSISGEYEVAKNTSTAMALGAKVDWDVSANELVATTAGDLHGGVVVKAAATADATVRIRINVANQTA
ncbi:MAG: DUF2190 family protein [Planctomycetales bacterium]|nr:DUF2190 family protein [Planctomycetales bacterium]